MTVVIQRVNKASVTVGGECVGTVGRGLMLLVGVKAGDTEEDARVLCAKIAKLRIFEDGEGRMNLSVNDIGGGALAVSNFTLLANYSHGNRPDFFSAEKPARASELFDFFVLTLSGLISGGVQTGVFGADMTLNIENNGPVTVVMDSEKLKK